MADKKNVLNICSFSGGKDSIAMLLRMIETGMKVDIILFFDTGLEFPQMYEHIKKVEQTINRKVTVVKSEYDFEYLFLTIPIKHRPDSRITKRYGADIKGYGWPGPKMRWCTNRLKAGPRERFLRQFRQEYDLVEYVGIAVDEEKRIAHKCNRRANVRLPLVEWGMTEEDCLNYCRERGFDWSGLYDVMKRVSCWCCPLQSLKELRVLYHEFPELWEQLKKWDEMTWRNFRADYSVKQLEERFDFEEEWIEAGHALRTKAFFCALKERLENP